MGRGEREWIGEFEKGSDEMAEKIRDYTRLASQIVDEVGGTKNIITATRCATRLRLILRETPAGAKDKVSALPGVISVLERAGQFQVVIGAHVGELYESVANLLPAEGSVAPADMPKESLVNRVIATMSGTIMPFVYVLAAAGFLQGLLILTRMAWPEFEATGTHAVLNFISWTPFAFLPIFVAVTASNFFHCNVFVAMACCAALVNPGWVELAQKILAGEHISFLGIPLTSTMYGGQVLPPILLVWMLAKLEKFLNSFLPSLLRSFLTPMICMAIMVPATLIVIGPITIAGATFVADSYNWLVNKAPIVAAALVGGFWQVPVIFGMHHGAAPIMLANFANHGYDTLQALLTMAVVAQLGAAFGVARKTKSREMRNVGISAGITGLFGITEPIIYGVTLRLKKPFICGCIAGAVGAVVASFFHVKYFIYAGLAGPLTLVNAISPEQPSSFIGMVIGCLVSLVTAFVLVQIVGFKDLPAGTEAAVPAETTPPPVAPEEDSKAEQ